jgi:hypothetical protein
MWAGSGYVHRLGGDVVIVVGFLNSQHAVLREVQDVGGHESQLDRQESGLIELELGKRPKELNNHVAAFTADDLTDSASIGMIALRMQGNESSRLKHRFLLFRQFKIIVHLLSLHNPRHDRRSTHALLCERQQEDQKARAWEPKQSRRN